MNLRQAGGGCFCFVSLASIVALSTPSLARADDQPCYVGFDLGVSRYSKEEAVRVSPDLALSTSGSSLDNDDTTWALTAGYRFNERFAVEVGYVDLGESAGTLRGGTTTVPAFASIERSGSGFTVAGVATWQFGNWEPYLRLGVLFTETELTFSGANGSAAFSGKSTDRSTDPFGGLGLAYRFNDRWRAKTELTFYDDAATATIGFAYRF